VFKDNHSQQCIINNKSCFITNIQLRQQNKGKKTDGQREKYEKVNHEIDNNVPKCMAKQKNFTGVNEKAENESL
jgi:hypothetical protein